MTSEPHRNATIVALSAHAAPAAARQVLAERSETPTGGHSALADGVLRVRVRLEAHLSEGRSIVARDPSPVFQLLVAASETTLQAVRDELQQLLEIALGKADHRPPRSAWEPLIEQLAADGIITSEAELRRKPLDLVLSTELAATLGH